MTLALYGRLPITLTILLISLILLGLPWPSVENPEYGARIEGFQPPSRPTLRVPQDFPTIQAAIDAAPENALIQIAPGTYTERITITKSVRLVGSGTEQTILQTTRFQNCDYHCPSMITVRTVEGQDLQLHLERFTVCPSSGCAGERFALGTIGINVEGQGRTSLSMVQTRWVRMQVVLRAVTLQSLEIRESSFKHNYYIFDHVATGPTSYKYLEAQKIVISENRFESNIIGISLQGQDILVLRNIIIGNILSESTYYADGLKMVLLAKGRGEISGNTIMLTLTGMTLYQRVAQESTWVVRDNMLFMNSINIWIGQSHDVSIEQNSIIDGGVGILVGTLSSSIGGNIRLRDNEIRGQRIFWPPDPHNIRGDWLPAADGVLIIAHEKSLRIDMSENRISFNEGFGLALNRALNFAERRYGEPCGAFREGSTGPEIVGRDNIFRSNGKGDLCPPDYPWPPGFRK